MGIFDSIFGGKKNDKENKSVQNNSNGLPEWFDGKWYDEGADVTNPYTFKKYKLSPEELSIYDFIIGSSISINCENPDKKARKALEWFKEKNPEAYTNCVLPYIIPSITNNIGKLIADVLEENEIGYNTILFDDGTEQEGDNKDLENNEDIPNVWGSRDLLNSDHIYEREEKAKGRAKEVFKIPKFPSWTKLTIKDLYKWSDDEIFLVLYFSQLLANSTTLEELNKIEGDGWEDEYERNEMVYEVYRWLGHESFGGIKASGYKNGEYFEESYFPPFCLHLKQSKIEKIMKRRLNGDDYALR